MDHIEAIREKIAHLRSEIANIQVLNDEYRFGVQRGPVEQTAHIQRQQRLEEIKEELTQLSQLNRKAVPIEQMIGNRRFGLNPVRRVS